MASGIIKSFDPEDESGYIQPDDGGEEIPFDVEALDDYHEGDLIQEGERVTYEVEGGLAGIMATEVRRLRPRGYE